MKLKNLIPQNIMGKWAMSIMEPEKWEDYKKSKTKLLKFHKTIDTFPDLKYKDFWIDDRQLQEEIDNLNKKSKEYDMRFKKYLNENRGWFELGRDLSIKYQNMDKAGKTNVLKPNKEILDKMSKKYKISTSDIRRALDYFNWGDVEIVKGKKIPKLNESKTPKIGTTDTVMGEKAKLIGVSDVGNDRYEFWESKDHYITRAYNVKNETRLMPQEKKKKSDKVKKEFEMTIKLLGGEVKWD